MSSLIVSYIVLREDRSSRWRPSALLPVGGGYPARGVEAATGCGLQGGQPDEGSGRRELGVDEPERPPPASGEDQLLRRV